MDRYFTVNEIAQGLQVHRRTVIGWIESSQLAAIKLAGRRFWRIPEKDLRRFLKAK